MTQNTGRSLSSSVAQLNQICRRVESDMSVPSYRDDHSPLVVRRKSCLPGVASGSDVLIKSCDR